MPADFLMMDGEDKRSALYVTKLQGRAYSLAIHSTGGAPVTLTRNQVRELVEKLTALADFQE